MDKQNNKNIKKVKVRTFEELIEECMTKDRKAISLAKMLDREGDCGSNGGKGCDVTSGPCSCGGWH